MSSPFCHSESGKGLGAALVVVFALRQSGLQVVPGDLWPMVSGVCGALGYVLFRKLARATPGWEVIS